MQFSENLTAQLPFVINGSQISFLFEVFHACRLAFHQFLVYFKQYFEKSGNFLIRKEILSFFVMNFKQEFLQEIRKKEFLNHLLQTLHFSSVTLTTKWYTIFLVIIGYFQNICKNTSISTKSVIKTTIKPSQTALSRIGFLCISSYLCYMWICLGYLMVLQIWSCYSNNSNGNFFAIPRNAWFLDPKADYYQKYEEIYKNHMYRESILTKRVQTHSDDKSYIYAYCLWI